MHSFKSKNILTYCLLNISCSHKCPNVISMRFLILLKISGYYGLSDLHFLVIVNFPDKNKTDRNYLIFPKIVRY